MNTDRGALVVVRTAGGYPRLRRLWAFSPDCAIVAEESVYKALERGRPLRDSGAVGVPSEDVFRHPPELPADFDPARSFGGWSRLEQYIPKGTL